MLGIRTSVGEPAFVGKPEVFWAAWRIPFLLSAVLLAVSIWIRLRLNESPVFQRMKAEGKGSKRPLTEAFGNWANLKIAILALFGATAGEAVIWYGGQFYALFFLTQTLKVPAVNAQIMIAVGLLLGTPFFIIFGWLSDKIGRKPIILAGLRSRRDHLFPDLPGNHALRKSETGGGTCQRAGDGRRRSVGVLVPVQSGRHCEVHHLVRHRKVDVGGTLRELPECRSSERHESRGEGRRTDDLHRYAELCASPWPGDYSPRLSGLCKSGRHQLCHDGDPARRSW